MSETIEAETKPKIRMDPSLLCLDDDAVRLNARLAYLTLVEFNQAARGSKLEQEIDQATKYVATYNASPIIVTPVPTENAQRLLMSYNAERLSTGNDRQAILTSSLRDYMRWSALRASFERSGVPVHTHMLTNSVGSRGVWPRDFYFKIGNHAFFPDPEVMADCWTMTEGLRQEIREAHNEIVQIVTQAGLTPVIVSGIDFEVGDIIIDPVENYLFWGHCYYPCEEDTKAIEDAIYQHTESRYRVIPIERGKRYGHLDIGMSPKLPNDNFLVSFTLGQDGGCRHEGYERLKDFIGCSYMSHLLLRKEQRDRIITVSAYDAFENLVTNLITMGPVVFMSYCDYDRREMLSADGIVVNAPDPAQPFAHTFQCRNIGDGGVRCLTNEL